MEDIIPIPADYSASVVYVRHDGTEGRCFIAGNTAHDAVRHALDMVAYYVTEGFIAYVDNVVAFCRACEGQGTRPYVRHRRRAVWAAKRTACKACKGAGHWSVKGGIHR